MNPTLSRSSSISPTVPAVSDWRMDTPIFLTGFARSGTTLVNRILCDYFDAGFVNEGQFIISFGLRLARYGDLQRSDNHRRLVQDISEDRFFSILKKNYDVEIDWPHVATVLPTFAAIVLDILRQISDQMGKGRIGSKYPVFGRHLNLLSRHFPDCRIVHVVRDGRDCALSHKHVRWGHQNTYAAAVHWRDYLLRARTDAQSMPGRYLEINYEDLLSKPESSIALLEKFITGASAGPVTGRFMRDAQRLKPEKIARWRQAMTPHAQAIFEGVAGDALRQAGYPLTGIAHQPSFLSRGLYVAHDRLSREAWYLARKVFPGISEYR
ncbi:MAG: sulfotransferase [Rhodanobacter sp.]|nr:MAG: sulfotransferase [Rhodanobacter sp.]